MNRICLYYFSGTGFTKYVVDKFISELAKQNVSVDCFKIENVDNVVLSECDAMGIAYPVHSFNAPKIVINFAKRLPKANGLKTFILHTAASDYDGNNASSDLLIKKLSKKGYAVFYNKRIVMPSNFVSKFSDEKVNEILGKANADVPHIANDILGFKHFFMKKSIGSAFMAFVGRVEWFGAYITSKFYYAKNNCTRCGKCVDNCPNKNIIMKKTVGFKWRCGLCMRCIYQCPQNAINIRQPFKFFRFDKWYENIN